MPNDAEGACIDPYDARIGSAKQARKRFVRREPSTYAANPAVGEARVGDPDADAALTTEREQGIAKAPGRDRQRMALGSVGNCAQRQQDCG